MLARVVANEAGVPFLSCTGSDFVEAFAAARAARTDTFRLCGTPCAVRVVHR